MDDLRHNYTYEEPGEGARLVLEPGEYEFEVKEVFDFETSKKGNDMLPIDLTIFGPNGQTTTVSEYLVFAPSAKWKIDGFLKSTGKAPKVGEKVDFDNLGWMQRARGRCIIEIEEFTKKNGDPGQKNVLGSYVYPTTEMRGRTVTGPAPRQPAPPPADEEVEDDVPF